MSEPAWFQTLGHRRVYEGFSTVRIDEVRDPGGNVLEREVVERPVAVAVVPVTVAGDVLLLRHYRQPVGASLLELPAGLMDVAGESPADTARRELAEELAHEVDELETLTTMWNSAGWSTERTHVFLGRDARPARRPEDFTLEGEEAHLEAVALPFEVAVAAVLDGTITDAKTVVGLLLADRRRG